MGITDATTSGGTVDQDAFYRAVGDELSDKGFVVAQVDKLVNWARAGSPDPLPVQGGRSRKYCHLTPEGRSVLDHSAEMLTRMMDGLPAFEKHGGT